MSSPLPNSSFSDDIPGLQTAWDSTSLTTFMSCPRKYQLSMIEQWNSLHQSVALTFGILFHKGMEIFEKTLAEPQDRDGALRNAIIEVLLESGEYKFPEGWSGDFDSDYEFYASIIEDLPDPFTPWPITDDKRNRNTLVRALIWYVSHYDPDPAQTIILKNGRPAVELSFKIPLPLETPTGDHYLLCGHIDRLVRFLDQVWVLDYKTTSTTINASYFSKFSPHLQLSLYTMAANVIYPDHTYGAIVDAIQLAVGSVRFGRSLVTISRGRQDEWYAGVMATIKLAERMALDEEWPMNEQSCHDYGGCRFRDICSQDPCVREAFLEAEFVRKPWDPLINR